MMTVAISRVEKDTEKMSDSTSSVVDIKLLQSRYGKNGRQLVEAFAEDAPAEIENLRKALAEKDVEGFLQICHGLKGASGTACAPGMKDICSQMELAGRQGRQAEWTQLLSLLEKECNKLVSLVKDKDWHA